MQEQANEGRCQQWSNYMLVTVGAISAVGALAVLTYSHDLPGYLYATGCVGVVGGLATTTLGLYNLRVLGFFRNLRENPVQPPVELENRNEGP